MGVLIYRTRLTKNIKRFGKFGLDLKRRLCTKGIAIDIVNDAKKDICLNQMQEYETIVIIAHGDNDKIYHRLHKTISKTQTLISNFQIHQKDQKVISAIQGKKIIAISCRTARSLGDYACKFGGCRVYLGFYNKIHFNKSNNQFRDVSPEYYQFLLNYYKNVFTDVLEIAIERHWSFLKLATILKIELQRRIKSAIKNDSSINSSYYKQIVFGQAYVAVINVADNIKLFGNEQEEVG